MRLNTAKADFHSKRRILIFFYMASYHNRVANCFNYVIRVYKASAISLIYINIINILNIDNVLVKVQRHRFYINLVIVCIEGKLKTGGEFKVMLSKHELWPYRLCIDCPKGNYRYADNVIHS